MLQKPWQCARGHCVCVIQERQQNLILLESRELSVVEGAEHGVPLLSSLTCVTPRSSSHRYCEGLPPNMLTKSNADCPPSTLLRPWNIALLEIVSYALNPSTEIVALGFISVKPCNTWEMHSHPALVAWRTEKEMWPTAQPPSIAATSHKPSG